MSDVAPWEEEYRRVELLRRQFVMKGVCLGWANCQISYWRLGETIYCWRSPNQIDYYCSAADWETYPEKFRPRLSAEPTPYLG